MSDVRLESVEDDQHSQRKTIRLILGQGRTGAPRQFPLLDIPFRYERALRQMEHTGELSIGWECDPQGVWVHYVRLNPVHPNGQS